MECLVENGQVTSRMNDDEIDDTNITFFYTVGEGVCPKSFGINVARLADLPHDVLVNVKRVSSAFEKEMVSVEGNQWKVTARNAADLKLRIPAIREGTWDQVGTLWQEMQDS
jgi:DNA mismatch repair protein MSH6